MTEFTPSDLAFLHEAVAYLETPSYLMRLADAVGGPLQSIATKVVPARIKSIGNQAIRRVMTMASSSLDQSIQTTDFAQARRAAANTGLRHRLAATATGGI